MGFLGQLGPLFVFVLVAARIIISVGGQAPAVHLNQWAVEIRGGKDRAREIADELGFVYAGPVSSHAFFCFHLRLLFCETACPFCKLVFRAACYFYDASVWLTTVIFLPLALPSALCYGTVTT